MKDSVIVVSGGMDSVTLLYEKKDEIALGISFDYGSNHNHNELPLAALHCHAWALSMWLFHLALCTNILRVVCWRVATAYPTEVTTRRI